MSAQTIRTEAADGLNQLVSRGAAAVREAESAPLGVLTFELAAADLGALSGVLVEAEYSQRSAGLARLDVRAAGPVTKPFRESALAALSKFGGTAYTNLVAKTRSNHELFDVTVSFPRARFGFYAENTLLLGEPAAETEAACTRALGALGVRHSGRGAELRVPRRQLRSALDVNTQLAAQTALFELELIAELYTARLPATHSVRVLGDGSDLVDVWLSRGLASDTSVSAADYVDLGAFLRDHFGFEIRQKTWSVSNAHGTVDDGKLGVIPARPKTTWSVNWGTKRRM